jgi:hypothetical protein
VRASNFEPLRFYALTKFAPNQQSDIKIGLPTLTIGAGQTSLQKQTIFGNNLTDNSASLNYEIDPLETKEFTSGITDPISDGLLAKLLTLFPRELVFYTVFSAIRVRDDTGYHEFRNDPALDTPRECPPFGYRNFDPSAYDPSIEEYSPYNPAYERYSGVDHTNCSFHRFQFYIEEGIKYGATIKQQAAPKKAYSKPSAIKSLDAAHGDGRPLPNASKNASATPPSSTDLPNAVYCYDLALARRDVVGALASQSSSVCDMPQDSKPRPSAANSEIRIGWLDPVGRLHVVNQTIDLVRRSPVAIFLYLGRLLATSKMADVRLFTRDATDMGDEQILTIVADGTSPCFAEVDYLAQGFCVPARGAYNTKRLFLMLTLMTNLSTSPSDIPNTLSVRVTP